MAPSDKNSSKAINAILGVMALVGIATLLIVLGFVFGGMWLDKQLGTGKIFTFSLVLASIPMTIFVMYKIARGTVARIAKSKEENKNTDS